jgi:AmmeMemoRadiSam system protein B
MATFIRPPAVAGRFYPHHPEQLLQQIHGYTAAAGEKLRALGCVAPHAGYMYSGHVAGAVYARIQLPKRFIILCPNHTGMGEPLAIMSRGAWTTPLGDAPIDGALAQELMQACPQLAEDAVAHSSEHALEVQLPFLQALAGEFTFVPIVVGTSRLETLQLLGETMADVIGAQAQPPLIVSSSDMNHYESDAITRVKDHKAIDAILALDATALYDVVREENISMCGYAPTVAMLTAARRLGARAARLIKYATSGDISGEREHVVGYAGIAVY